MSLAEREMRRLQRELQDALAKNAPDDEIERLMRELQQALDRYLQALAENLARNPDQAEQSVDPSRVLTSRALQRMIDRARELARDGARDQARELLSQLQNMRENLRMAKAGPTAQRGSTDAQRTRSCDGSNPAKLLRPKRRRSTNCSRRRGSSRSRCSAAWVASIPEATRSEPPTAHHGIGSSAIRSVARCRATVPTIRAM